MKRIFIVVPVYQYPAPECVEAIINIVSIFKHDYDFVVRFVSDYTTDQARNRAVAMFLASECDYMLCIDSDIILTEEAFAALMRADKDVISGVYCKKSLQIREAVIYKVEGKEFKPYKPDDVPQEVFPIDACGFGCVLLKRDVLRVMNSRLKGVLFRFIQQPIVVSEDIFFCNELKKAGYELYCAGTARVGHVGKYLY